MSIPNENPTGKTSGPTASAETPEDVAKAIELLRDRLDALEIKAAERESPWYRQGSFLLSLFAVVVSFAFSALTVYYRKLDLQTAETAAKVALVRQNIIGLAELQVWFIEAQQRFAKDENTLNQLSSASNAKRQMLIEETESLIGTLKGHLTSAEYLNFGGQVALDARMDSAFAYYQHALTLAPNPLAKSAAYRAMAMASMQPGGNANAGRYYWRRNLELLNGNDPYSLFLRANVLSIWSDEERALNNGVAADSLARAAQEIAKRLPSTSQPQPPVPATDPPATSATITPSK